MSGGPRWVRHGSRWAPPTERPTWWPANEPFPGPDWRRTRVRFMRRMAVFALVAFLTFAFVVAALVALLVGFFGGAGSGAFVPLAAFVLLVVAFNVARGVRRLIVPLGDLIDAAERVESGDYSVRVRVRGPRELKALSRAFNEMSEHLERSEAERRRLLADVTHELRTPLTVMQGNIEALIDGVRPTDETHLRAILDDTHVLARLIDDLRTISVAEAGALTLHCEPTDVAALVRDTVASFETAAASSGVALRADGAGGPTASIDPVRIREVLTNVIANALRYTPRDGSIVVTTSATADAVSVSVRDAGAGIAPEALPHVFERFARSDDSPGAGLGLAIAKSLVSAHGGTITALSTPGQGTEIRFALPVTARAAAEG